MLKSTFRHRINHFILIFNAKSIVYHTMAYCARIELESNTTVTQDLDHEEAYRKQ